MGNSSFFLEKLELNYHLILKRSCIQTFNSLKKVFQPKSIFEISGLAEKLAMSKLW